MWIRIGCVIAAVWLAARPAAGQPATTAPANDDCLACHGDPDAKSDSGRTVAVDAAKFIDSVHGAFLLPDTNAHGGPDRPQHVYSVRFSARELWGEEATERDGVYIDLWEDYLEPQPA